MQNFASLFSPIGSIGDIVFQVNPIQIKTYRDMTISVAAEFADHNVAGSKAVSEFLGPVLQSGSLTIDLNRSLGIDPQTELEKLIAVIESGKPQTMVLGFQNKGPITLRSAECQTTHVDGLGIVLLMEIGIQFTEYIESFPSQARTKQQQDRVQRSDTGKGGPERLPGSSAATKSRTLTKTPSSPKIPKIDPVTKMVIK